MWSLVYGDCTPEGGDTPSCSPPAELQNYAACARSLRSIAPEVRSHRLTRVRGALAAVYAGGGRFDRLEIFTRRTTIVVFARSLREARRLSAALRTVDGRIGPGDPLPPAGRGTLANRVSCRRG